MNSVETVLETYGGPSEDWEYTPKPYTLNPKSSTLNPNPQPSALDPKPLTFHQGHFRQVELHRHTRHGSTLPDTVPNVSMHPLQILREPSSNPPNTLPRLCSPPKTSAPNPEPSTRNPKPWREREMYRQPTGPSPLDHRDDCSRTALCHGCVNSRFPGSLISTRNPNPQVLYETVVLDMERVKLLESDKAVRFVLDQVTIGVFTRESTLLVSGLSNNSF